MKSNHSTTLKFFSISILFACLANGQGRSALPESVPNLPAQRIGPRDLVAIQVYDSPELTRTVRVSDDGMIRLPMLKEKLKAEGLMPGDLEILVAKALEEEGMINDPFVTITVAEYSSRPISVAGA